MSRDRRKGAVDLTTLLHGCPDLVYPEQRTACGDSGEAGGLIGELLTGVRGIEGYDPLEGEVRVVSEIARRR
jgi:hypothetical protein